MIDKEDIKILCKQTKEVKGNDKGIKKRKNQKEAGKKTE